ncbi:MAG: type II toxin-antitoxin system RelE/ParE family toxin [Moorellales bacterium]
MVTVDIEPIAEFLSALDPRLRAKVYRGIDLLANNWPLIGEPHVRHVTSHAGLWELRESLGNVRVRVFFFQPAPGTLAAVHAFVKKSRKTPRRELSLALKKKAEYERRMRKE